MQPIEISKNLMGTMIQVTIYNPRRKVHTLNAIDKAMARFEYVIKKFSRFDKESELSKLNRSQGKWVKLSRELFYLIEKSLTAAKESNYLFDPTILDLLSAYGYDKSYDQDRILARAKLKSFKREVAFLKRNRPRPQEIELDKANRRIKLMPKQKIDLGASGKGYAIDLAKEVLEAEGFRDFIVNAGGDIWAAGKKKIALFDPRRPSAPLGITILKNKAIAGSGSFAHKAGIFHHILNPALAKPENKILQTYVTAPTALEADTYATVLFLLGSKGTKLILKKNYQALIIKHKSVKQINNFYFTKVKKF